MRSRQQACSTSVALVVLCLLVRSARAQQPQSEAKPERSVSVADLEKGSHTGPVEQALVGIRITGTKPDGTPLAPRSGNGVVIRCDGFVVVPFNLFNLSKDSAPSAPEKQTIHITYWPGDEREQRITMPRRSRWFIDNMRRYGLTVFRTDGAVHVPALRTLLSDTLRPGDSVEVVWREADPSTGKFGPLVRRVSRLAKRSEDVSGEGLAEDTFDHPGRIRFSEPLEGVPAGAVVLGPEGMGIGVIPGAGGLGTRDSFVSFAVLAQLTNCVGAVPIPDGAYRSSHVDTPVDRAEPEKQSDQERSSTGGASSMVRVPGGPVIVPKAMLSEQPDMEGEPIACMAPFEIDKFEVTNAEYLAFWNSLTEKQRADPTGRQAMYPLGWAPGGEPFPDSIAGLPVLGVPLLGAEAYAKSQGKRLPTPYEWAKAALGPKGETETPEWIRRYIADRKRAWVELARAHADYLQVNPALLIPKLELDKDGKSLQTVQAHQSTPGWYKLPWIVMPRGYGNEQRFSFELTSQLINSLMEGWRSPIYVIPPGSRPYDVSPYGAMDMLINAWELYQPNPGSPVFRNARYLEMEWDMEEQDHDALRQTRPFHPSHWDFAYLRGWPRSETRLSRLYKRTVRPRQDRPVTYFANDTQLSTFHLTGGPEPVSMEYLVFAHNLDLVWLMVYPLHTARLVARGLYEIGGHSPYYYLLGSHEDNTGKLVRVPAVTGRTKVDIGATYRPNVSYPWAAGAMHYSQELGYPPALRGTLLVPTQKPPADNRYQTYSTLVENSAPAPPDLFYILPVGFRCAR